MFREWNTRRDFTACFSPDPKLRYRSLDAIVAREWPSRADPRQVTHQQSRVESANMDQQSLAHVGVPPDEDPTNPPVTY